MNKLTRITAIILVVLSLGTLLAGCGNTADVGGKTPNQKNEPEQEDVLQQGAPTSRNYNKAAKMFAELAGSDTENVMLSTVSLEAALGLVMSGSDGETLTQLEKFTNTSNDGMVERVQKLMKRAELSETLDVANSVWINTETVDKVPVKQSYKDDVMTNYSSKIVEDALIGKESLINDWVNESTHGMIKEIMNPNDITDETAVILANAVYFKGTWNSPFDSYYTEDEKFTCVDGSKKEVATMKQYDGDSAYSDLTYFENKQAQAVIKPYLDNYVFIAILPKERGKIDLSKIDIDSLLSKPLSFDSLTLNIPKFKYGTKKQLVEPLMNNGVINMFSDADFSKMFDYPSEIDASRYVNQVVQLTEIDFNEAGTEASAVTMITMDTTCSADQKIKKNYEMICDRPFAYMIADKDTNEIIFTGIVYDPSIN